MPRFISKDGVWHPAKEHAVLPHLAGTENEVYDGPDRAALFELYKQKVNTLGVDFRQDPELINRTRQLGYESVDDYAKAMGYDKEAVEKNFEEKAAQVTKHELPDRVESIKTLGGGRDFAGQGEDAYGGFGKPKDVDV
jgi:hypothetical protein